MMRRPAIICASLLPTLAIVACWRGRDVAVEIPFTAVIDGAPFSCSTAGGGFSPFDLRFYVHGITLVDDNDNAIPVRLTDDGVWQSRGVALLDFENGSDNCLDGTAGTHTALLGRVVAGRYKALQFVLGVPFDRNHSDAATADAPLNLGRMHWGWQGGYKFFRFEGAGTSSAFRFHLGSTGCEGTIGNVTGCNRPNRAIIRLDSFEPGRNSVQIDLGALLPQTGATETAPAKTVSCMSEKDDPNCGGPFAALGIDVASGKPSGTQKLFKVVAMNGGRT